MSVYGHLSRIQTKEIHDRIIKAGLDPNDFYWTQGVWGAVSYEKMPLLEYGPVTYDGTLPALFHFGYSDSPDDVRTALAIAGIDVSNEGKHSFQYAPGDYERVTQRFFISWPDLLTHFNRWLWIIEEIQNTPDVWAEDSAFKRAVTTIPEPTNEHFSPSEITVIRKQYDALAEAVKSQGLLQGMHYDAFMQWKAESEEAAGRLTKKDWKNHAVGGFMALLMTLTLPPDARNEIGRLFGLALTAIQNVPLYLP